MNYLIENDPKSLLRDFDDPELLLNQRNKEGHTPLYLASKNGNLNVVRLLLQNKANPYILSKLGPGENESTLSVAARWGHLKIVKELLNKCHFDNKELRKCFRVAMTKEIQNELKTKIKKKSWFLFSKN